MQDAVIFYKEMNLNTIRKSITGHYWHSEDLCEVWFICQKRPLADWRESGILVMPGTTLKSCFSYLPSGRLQYFLSTAPAVAQWTETTPKSHTEFYQPASAHAALQVVPRCLWPFIQRCFKLPCQELSLHYFYCHVAVHLRWQIQMANPAPQPEVAVFMPHSLQWEKILWMS